MNTQNILQNIYNTHGTLTPKLLLQEATNPDHPLHNHFEWDNTKAAQQWRETQAAQIIRSIKITYQETPQKTVRAFVNIKKDPDNPHGTNGHYQPIDTALRNDLTRTRLLQDMNRDWKIFKAKYAHMTEYAALLHGETTASDTAEDAA